MFHNVLHRQMLIPLVLGAFNKQGVDGDQLRLSAPNLGERDFDPNAQPCSSSRATHNKFHRDQSPSWTALVFYRVSLDLMTKTG